MSNEETDYRLRMAEGFHGEARHNIRHELWRSCVDNAQLAADIPKTYLSRHGRLGGGREARPPGATCTPLDCTAEKRTRCLDATTGLTEGKVLSAAATG